MLKPHSNRDSEVHMLLDEFSYAGRFLGEKPDGMNQDNFDSLVQQHGAKWVDGYLKAMELVSIELSIILKQPEDNPGGLPRTAHIVRKQLQQFWSENLQLTKELMLLASNSSKPTGLDR